MTAAARRQICTVTKRFYITTPIYYANDRPHIGHAYSTLLADVLARYHRLLGYEVFFLTGTDEHGQKVQQAAAKRGVSPQQQVDEFHQRFKELWQKLDVQYDRFIRTTDADHKEFVRSSMQELFDRGEIYEKEYEGWYSVGEERFFSDEELVDGKDPVTGNPVEWLKEKNYFFKMSKYQDALIKKLQDDPDFVQPDFRRNEVLGFLRNPLQDLCISRPRARLEWGIPLPFDEDFVTYVWFDALLNYQSGVIGKTFTDGAQVWPANYHIIGKDILTTHAVYWPTMLMAMGRPLPEHILAHGWWLSGGKKQSKSQGNVVNPLDYISKHGTDAVRYFLMREMVLGQDASFTDELFVSRVNSDLANDLGNAINRVSKFVQSHFDSRLPAPGKPGAAESALRKTAEEVSANTASMVQSMKLSFALEEIAGLVRAVNRYFDGRAPWKLVKSNAPDAREELGTVLYTAAEALRLALVLLTPVMPQRGRLGLAMLGAHEEPTADHLNWGRLSGGEALSNPEALFPRIETKPDEEDPAGLLDFRVAEIISAEEHPDAEALLVLKLQLGDETRTVCAGIRKVYQSTELPGKRVVLFANLKPAKLRGIESQGMLLAADAGAGPRLVDPGSLAHGTRLGFANIAPQPKAKATLKDFEKVPLQVISGQIRYRSAALGAGGVLVSSEAPDGTEVR